MVMTGKVITSVSQMNWHLMADEGTSKGQHYHYHDVKGIDKNNNGNEKYKKTTSLKI